MQTGKLVNKGDSLMEVTHDGEWIVLSLTDPDGDLLVQINISVDDAKGICSSLAKTILEIECDGQAGTRPN